MNRKRYGVLFYNDGGWQEFEEGLNKLAPGVVKKWYKKYATICKDIRVNSDEGIELKEEIQDACKDISFDEIEDTKGRWGNKEQIVIGPYKGFFIKIRGLLLEKDSELVISYATSKNWDLPVNMLLMNGKWQEQQDLCKFADDNKCKEEFLGLHCCNDIWIIDTGRTQTNRMGQMPPFNTKGKKLFKTIWSRPNSTPVIKPNTRKRSLNGKQSKRQKV